jgi:hypothetical protein
LQFEVTGMKSNSVVTLLAVAVVVAWQSASTRAGDELALSEFGVQLAAYERAAAAEPSVVRTAFLDDVGGQPLQAHSGLLHRQVRQSHAGRGDECPECSQFGEAWRYGPSSDCGACPCGAACECGSACGSTCNCGCGDECASECDYGPACEGQDADLAQWCEANSITRRQLYGEVQVMWLRAHIMEDAIGKLSEQYKFSPRLVVGFEDPCGVGARMRYWHYDHATETLDNNDLLGLSFDVVDAEVTGRFAVRKTDVVFSGGARWVTAEVDLNDEAVSTDMMLGLTVAADLRTQICGGCNKQWAGVAGGRWSTLGGNWDGSSQSFIPAVRDDNVVVQELYAGVEYMCCTRRGHNLYARLTFEIQNWHSDAAAQSAGADSIGFVGPGVHVGGSF